MKLNNAPIKTTTVPQQLPAFAPGWALFLDIDGTLARLASTPDAVTIEAEVIDVVRRLGQLMDKAVALITGRAIADTDRLFAPLKLPVAGQHGIERRGADGRIATHPDAERALDEARHALGSFAAANAGVFFEDKRETLAVHYRAAPGAEPAVHRLMHQQLALLGDNFMLQRGKQVLELRPSGRDKGTAIEAFMLEAPFRTRTPVFIGDDDTDEDGFRVVNHLGGQSIKVGNGDSAARWRLKNASAVLDWLRSYAEFIQSDAGDV